MLSLRLKRASILRRSLPTLYDMGWGPPISASRISNESSIERRPKGWSSPNQIHSLNRTPSEAEYTIMQLADVLRALGRGHLAVEGGRALLSLQRERGDRAGELRALVHLGTELNLSGLPKQAANVFEEGVRLS